MGTIEAEVCAGCGAHLIGFEAAGAERTSSGEPVCGDCVEKRRKTCRTCGATKVEVTGDGPKRGGRSTTYTALVCPNRGRADHPNRMVP